MTTHASDCAQNNMPALPAGQCDCGQVTIIPPQGLSVGFVWQPIETAPMDGTEVILFYPHMSGRTSHGLVTAGYFHIAEDDYASHWYADLVNGGASPPSHWMPLPNPPQR